MFETEGETPRDMGQPPRPHQCRAQGWGSHPVSKGSFREDCRGTVRFLFFSLEKSLWRPILKIIARPEASKGRVARRLFLLWGEIARPALSPEAHEQNRGERRKHPTSAVEMPGVRSAPGPGTEQLVCPGRCHSPSVGLGAERDPEPDVGKPGF